ncbi:MAG TPA: PEP-CTERM sorting domain-containing protein [Tepidisphaeraceae bacterium]|nr:PEP-CTERM sorting domain-containing protein [Tepidisphaeraceae bacterium]
MRRKRACLIWSAAGAVLGIGAVGAMAQTAALSITANATSASGGTWSAYVALDSGTDNVGLAAFSIDVIGSDGLKVTGSYDEAPVGVNAEGNKDGFQEFPSNGNPLPGQTGNTMGLPTTPGDGIAIDGGQNVVYAPANSNIGDNEIIQGFGQGELTTPIPEQPGITWGFPALLADGTYSGSSGVLTVQGDLSIGAGLFSLNIVSDGKWVGPGNVSTDRVISGSVVIVPEPSSIGPLGLGAIGLMRRRRNKTRKGGPSCGGNDPI